MKTEYPKSSLVKYEIKLQKGRDRVMKSTYDQPMVTLCFTAESTDTRFSGVERIKRGVKQHDLFDQMHDAVRLGIITHAELLGVIIGKTYGGSVLEDVTAKYLDGIAGGGGSKNLPLSGERA